MENLRRIKFKILMECIQDGERYQDAGLQAAGRTVRLLRVQVRAMLLVEDGSGLFRNDSVEETGATHCKAISQETLVTLSPRAECVKRACSVR